MKLYNFFLLLCYFFILAVAKAQNLNETSSQPRVKRLIGDNAAAPGQFPFQVSLFKKKSHKKICGGSILNKDHVLTAAHCFVNDVYKFKNISMSVVAGVTDLDDPNNKNVTIDVTRVYIAKDYFDANFDIIRTGDIAVLKLQKSFKFGGNIQPIKLPKNKTKSYNDEKLMFSGFGYNFVKMVTMPNNKTERILGRVDNSMRYVRMKAMNCLDTNAYDKPISMERHLCAVIDTDYDQSQGLCKGDSGNTLVVGKKTAVGIHVKNRIYCNNTVIPVIMTRITSYLDFIKNAKTDNSTSPDGFYKNYFVYNLPVST